MAGLKIYKVDSKPTVFQPSALYLVKDSGTGLLYVYLTDKLGSVIYRSYESTDITNLVNALINSLKNQPNGLAGLDANGNIIGNIIATFDGQDGDIRSDNDYVWEDMLADITVKGTSGGNNPTFGPIYGDYQGYIFSPSSMNQCWIDFHIKHDIALNTKLYPHIHYLPMTNSAGVVRWGISYSIAKGHQQQKFPLPTTVYIEQTIPLNSQYLHMVAEVSDLNAILSTSIEPDSVIKMRVFRDAAHPNDTYPNEIHAWQVDIHYQRARLGTRNKSPNFFL